MKLHVRVIITGPYITLTAQGLVVGTYIHLDIHMISYVYDSGSTTDIRVII